MKRRRLVQPQASSDEEASSKSAAADSDAAAGDGDGSPDHSQGSPSKHSDAMSPSSEDEGQSGSDGDEEDGSSEEEEEESSDEEVTMEEAGEDGMQVKRRMKRDELMKTRTNKAKVQDGERTDIPVSEKKGMEPKPMVELKAGTNIWYQAYVLKESANEVKIEVPVSSRGKRKPVVEWLLKGSSRIWRGSLKAEHWKHLGKGAWEPKIPPGHGSGKRPRGTGTSSRRPAFTRSSQRSEPSGDSSSSEHNSAPHEEEVMSPRPPVTQVKPSIPRPPRAVITAEGSTGTGSVDGATAGKAAQRATQRTGAAAGGSHVSHKKRMRTTELAELSDHEHVSTHSPLPSGSHGPYADQNSTRAASSLGDPAAGEVAPSKARATSHQPTVKEEPCTVSAGQAAGPAPAAAQHTPLVPGAMNDPLTRWFLKHISTLAHAGMLTAVPEGSLEAGALPPGFSFDPVSHTIVAPNSRVPVGLSSTQAGSRQASPTGLQAATGARPAASNASQHGPKEPSGAAAAAGTAAQSASSPTKGHGTPGQLAQKGEGAQKSGGDAVHRKAGSLQGVGGEGGGSGSGTKPAHKQPTGQKPQAAGSTPPTQKTSAPPQTSQQKHTSGGGASAATTNAALAASSALAARKPVKTASGSGSGKADGDKKPGEAGVGKAGPGTSAKEGPGHEPGKSKASAVAGSSQPSSKPSRTPGNVGEQRRPPPPPPQSDSGKHASKDKVGDSQLVAPDKAHGSSGAPRPVKASSDGSGPPKHSKPKAGPGSDRAGGASKGEPGSSKQRQTNSQDNSGRHDTGAAERRAGAGDVAGASPRGPSGGEAGSHGAAAGAPRSRNSSRQASPARPPPPPAAPHPDDAPATGEQGQGTAPRQAAARDPQGQTAKQSPGSRDSPGGSPPAGVPRADVTHRVSDSGAGRPASNGNHAHGSSAQQAGRHGGGDAASQPPGKARRVSYSSEDDDDRGRPLGGDSGSHGRRQGSSQDQEKDRKGRESAEQKGPEERQRTSPAPRRNLIMAEDS